jgi:tetratricopeptide (TPR) repeat protein
MRTRRWRQAGYRWAAALSLLALCGPACAPSRPTRIEVETASGLARLHAAEGRYEEALAIYRDLLDRTGGAPYVRLGLAAALVGKGDLRAAEREYRVILAGEASSPIALYNMASVLVRQGRRAEAAVFAGRFLELYAEKLPSLAQKARAMSEAPD